jgi:hypothetical protein
MAKTAGSYKFEKRRKEIARQKKQEEKRQRLLQKKQNKENLLTNDPSEETPLTPSEEISEEPGQPDNLDPVA